VTDRRVALVGGAVALAVGLAAAAAPGVVPVSVDRLAVTAVGVLALVQAYRVARDREPVEEVSTPDPELAFAPPPPGDRLNAALEPFRDGQRGLREASRIREGLYGAAVAVLTRYGAYTEREAERALADGSWTEDVHAAAFLGGDGAPDPPLRATLRDAFGRTSPLQRELRHTVDAVAAAAGVSVAARGDEEPPTEAAGSAEDGAEPRYSTTPASVGGEAAEGDDDPVDGRETNHWAGVGVVALAGIGVGILVQQPAVLLAGVVGVGYAAYARSGALDPGAVSVDRSLSTTDPDPGDEVEVTVTVRNESDSALADVRVVDGVPDALAVTDGSPRLGTALRGGEAATVSYAVTARRGVHEFGPVAVAARDLPSAAETVRRLPAGGELTCVPALEAVGEPVPLREQATQYVGRVEADSGGAGTEFHATREYRPGDPLNRVDWNRRARTGEFSTVEFREERAATVVVVVDAREAAYVAPDGEPPHAVDRAVDAAGQLFAGVDAAGNRVGLAALSAAPCWLPPGSGPDHRVDARQLLATHRALAARPATSTTAMPGWQRQFRDRLAPSTQVYFVTPLADEYSGRFARRLDEYGHPVTVVSPDATAARTPGHRLARIARRLRVSELRRHGIPVVDWPWADSLAAALARHNERWSQ
jgi:uncharacterized repeat protein (TIGR01451 family)